MYKGTSEGESIAKAVHADCNNWAIGILCTGLVLRVLNKIVHILVLRTHIYFSFNMYELLRFSWNVFFAN